MKIEKSEQINELAAALAKAQAEIVNPAKTSENPHYRNKYADLAEVLNVVRPVFAAHGLAVSQHPAMDGDGAMVTVETMLTHSSGQWMVSAVSAPVAKKDAQGVGSAITYCRRYALAAIAGVAQDDDDGNAAVGGNREQARPPATAAPAYDQGSVNGWNSLCSEFSRKDPEAFHDWWAANKADVITDCNEAGAKAVHAHFCKVLAEVKQAKAA